MGKKNKPVRAPSGAAKQQPSSTPTQGVSSVTVTRQRSGWAGPLPHPGDLAAYEAAVPGCGKDIIRWAEREGGATRATNRLVDLLTGPLRDPGRAAVELRRLIDRHPTSTAAAHAREALAKIKQTLAERAADS